jgi:hypothetical protein
LTIDPRYGGYFSLFAMAVSVLMLCGAEFTTLFGTIATTKILAGLGIFNALANGANGILHFIPSKPGATEQFPLGPK